jgi:hypothetical protein
MLRAPSNLVKGDGETIDFRNGNQSAERDLPSQHFNDKEPRQFLIYASGVVC